MKEGVSMSVGIIKVNNCVPERHDGSNYVYDLDIINMAPQRPEVENYSIYENDIMEEVKTLMKDCDVIDLASEVKSGAGGWYLGMSGSEYEAIYPYITFYANGKIYLWTKENEKLDITDKKVNEINRLIRAIVLGMD